LALLAVLAVAAAGCGSDEQAPTKPATSKAATTEPDVRYAKEIKTIDDDLDTAMQGLFGDQKMTDSEITAARGALDQSDSRLAKLTPPSNVRQYHEQYRRGVVGFGPIIDKLTAARGDTEQIRKHLSDPAYTAVIKDLDGAKKGYANNGYEL